MASTLARLTILALACACASAQYEEERQGRYIASEPKVAVTPVPILKQINKHNEDGSYTYGYEAADGSFKIETKSPTGEVKGKYGYKDDTGKVRVVEYGANKFGFQPSGEGITVAPPTLVDESKEERPKGSRNSNSFTQDYDYEEAAPAPRPRAPRPSPQQYRAPTPSQRSTSITASRPIKPAAFSGAAPAPIEENNLFNPAPVQTQQYRAPKQDFRFQQNFQPQIDYNEVSQPQKQTYNQGFSSQPSYQQSYQQPQQDYQQPQQSYQQPQQSYQQPQQSYQQPQQSYQQPQQNYQQQPQTAFQQKGFSMLDQLLKEYALPQGGAAPLHDITFGTIG